MNVHKLYGLDNECDSYKLNKGFEFKIELIQKDFEGRSQFKVLLKQFSIDFRKLNRINKGLICIKYIL